MGNGGFLGVKRPGRVAENPPPSSAEAKERIELQFYSPSVPAWHVTGKTLPLQVTLNPTLTLLAHLEQVTSAALRTMLWYKQRRIFFMVLENNK
jgi:hypothetical protein